MNNLLICDNCKEPFDVASAQKQNEPASDGGILGNNEVKLDGKRIPLILRHCGETLCSVCLSDAVIAANEEEEK